MRKFKLVKCYPGSGNIGAIHLGCNSYEEYPEFYEEILEVNFMVSLIYMGFHNAWEPIKVDAIKLDTDTKKYFSTKEGAETFIFYNKPCLSYSDVKKNIHVGYSTERIMTAIHNTVNERV